MNTQNRPAKILIYTWLFIALISLVSAIHAAINKGFTKDFFIFLGIFFLSLFMYKLRKKRM